MFTLACFVFRAAMPWSCSVLERYIFRGFACVVLLPRHSHGSQAKCKLTEWSKISHENCVTNINRFETSQIKKNCRLFCDIVIISICFKRILIRGLQQDSRFIISGKGNHPSCFTGDTNLLRFNARFHCCHHIFIFTVSFRCSF